MKNGSKRKELKVGIKLGKLTIIKEVESTYSLKTYGKYTVNRSTRMVECRCDCGNSVVREYKSIFKIVKKGCIPSCGCNRFEKKTRNFEFNPEVLNMTQEQKKDFIVNLIKQNYYNNEIVQITKCSSGTISRYRDELGLNFYKIKVEIPVGEKFGRLTVLGRVKRENKKNVEVECQCECGTIKIIRLCHLKGGNIKSCGCYMKEVARDLMVNGLHPNHIKHGDGVKTSEHHYLFAIWMGAKQRCYNPNNKRYSSYGERNIKMYEPWIDDYGAFKKYILETIGEKPKPLSQKRGDGYSLDRIDVNKGYEPDNLKWASFMEQMSNKQIHSLEHKTIKSKKEEGVSVPNSKFYKKIYEDFYNVKIKKGNAVHHIDWDSTNNDPSNLIEVTRKQHGWLHRLNNYKLKEYTRKQLIEYLNKIKK